MTKRNIERILNNNLIDSCTEQEKKEVFNYAFGIEFMNSNDKGAIKTY